MEHNPYQAPGAVVADTVSESELAGRGTRFGAAIIDGVLMVAIIFPLMYLAGYFQAATTGQAGFGLQLVWALIGLAVFAVVQGYPLHQSGQTWGKRILGIRIVDLAGQKPSLGMLLGKRYLPVQAVSAVPVLGTVLALVNVLLIFRGDRRCGHDLIAGTKVVKA